MIILGAANHDLGRKEKKLPEALEQTFLARLPKEAMLQGEKEWHSPDLIAVPPLITFVA